MLAWTAVTCLFVMLPLLICGKLRISEASELEGVDVGKVEEQSYTVEEGAGLWCQGGERRLQDAKASAQFAIKEEEGEEQEMAILSASFPAPTPPPSPPPSPSPSLAPPPSPPASSFPTEGFVEELRNTLKLQREQLREKTEELRPVEVAGEQGVDFGEEEEEEWSDSASVTSETAMQAAITAANRENFNYFQGQRPPQGEEGAREVVTVLRTTITRSNNIVRVLEPVEKDVSFAEGDRDGTFVKDDGEVKHGEGEGLPAQVMPALKVGFREDGEGEG